MDPRPPSKMWNTKLPPSIPSSTDIIWALALLYSYSDTVSVSAVTCSIKYSTKKIIVNKIKTTKMNEIYNNTIDNESILIACTWIARWMFSWLKYLSFLPPASNMIMSNSHENCQDWLINRLMNIIRNSKTSILYSSTILSL